MPNQSEVCLEMYIKQSIQSCIDEMHVHGIQTYATGPVSRDLHLLTFDTSVSELARENEASNVGH